MDLLRRVVQKRSESSEAGKDVESLGRFSSRVAKLRGEGPMATSVEPEVTLEVVSINIIDIDIPPTYLREAVGDVSPLVASIKTYGIQQPLKVVKIRGSKKYSLVFGRRRLEAAKIAGFDAVPCIVELVTKSDRLQMLALTENLHRLDVNPLEEAKSFHTMITQNNVSPNDIITPLNLSMEFLKEIISLLALPDSVKSSIIQHSESFSFPLLKYLCKVYAQSIHTGENLLQAILNGNIASPKEAERFIKS